MTPADSTPTPAPRPPAAPADVVRWALGALLLLAASAKVEQLASEPVNNCGRLACRWIGIVEAETEVLLGLWLLSGLAQGYARAMAGICFAVFAVVTLNKGLAGDASCGCFGKVQISPWYTLALDVAAVAALLILRRAGAGIPSGRRGRRIVALAFGAAAALAVGLTAWPMLTYEPARLTLDGRIEGQGAVLLDPSAWQGKPLPLLAGGRLAADVDLAKGDWTLILYRSACKGCRRELAQREREARRLVERGQPVKVVAAELGPVASAGENAVGPDSPLVRARLDEGRAWFVHTPLVITLRDGIVIRVETPAAEP